MLNPHPAFTWQGSRPALQGLQLVHPGALYKVQISVPSSTLLRRNSLIFVLPKGKPNSKACTSKIRCKVVGCGFPRLVILEAFRASLLEKGHLLRGRFNC